MSEFSFDLQTYLVEKGIDYQDSGKNTTAGWVEVQCPFCDDPSYHLGISPERFIHCWRCGAKGSVLRYVKETEDINWQQAKKVIGQFQDPTLSHLKRNIRERHGDKCTFPFNPVPLMDVHLNYLHSRRFDPNFIINTYKIKQATPHYGDWRFRIVVPLFVNGTMVNFTAMDYTGLQKHKGKYKHCPNENSVRPMRDCLYNIDSVLDTALIVEGVTDVWRMGPGTIAVMGVEYTKEQIKLLVERGVHKAVVMFDPEPEAQSKAERLAKNLSNFIKMVDTIDLDTGCDPGDLEDQDVREIREEVFGDVY